MAALNPHGSDGGLLGNEEAEEISPAVVAAKEQGIEALGPVPADTIFHQATEGRYDVVLAMFHDQGHIFGESLRVRGEHHGQLGPTFRSDLRRPRHGL